MGEELIGLGGAFLAAGLLARLGRRVGLPSIPFFMLAGLLFGPHTPGIVFVHDPAEIELFAAIGVVLLLFYLGLEFSLQDLAGGGGRLLAAGGVYLLLNVGGGLALGFAIGWGRAEALVLAGVVGISSSAIVTKLLIELRRLANPEARLILGIIVVEDLFLALYLAMLQPVLGGTEGRLAQIVSFGRAFAFILFLFLVARFGSRFVARLIASRDDELVTVLFLGLVVMVAGVAEEIGVSEAIGAFAVGLILGESPIADRVRRLVHPLRDAFGAVFFFAFGLTIAPQAFGDVLVPVAAAVALSLVLNFAAGLAGAKLHGFGRRAAANVGFTVLARGEFSLIIASLAAGAGLEPRIQPFVGLYVLILAVGSPLLAARTQHLTWLVPRRWFPPPRRRQAPPDQAYWE